MIVFNCPSCRQQLTAPEELGGQTFTCPHCNQRGMVPAGGGAKAPGVAAGTKAAPPGQSVAAGSSVSEFGGSILKHLAIGIGATLACYGVFALTGDRFHTVEKFTSRGWTPYVAVLLMFWSLSILLEKAFLIRRRRRCLDAVYVPDDAVLSTAEGVDRAIEAARSAARALRDTILGPRICRALEHFKGTWNVKEVGDILREESEADFAVAHGSYSLVRLFVWTIPILGFIGTVIGVGDAVGGFAGFLSAAQEVSQIRNALTGVTSGLSVAFDTTFVGLVLSVLVMMVMSAVEKMENDQLQLFEECCQDRILRRLPTAVREAGAGGGALVSAEQLRSILKEIVPGIETWRSEAQKVAAALNASLKEAWEKAGSRWFEGVEQIRRAASEGQAAQRELFERTEQECKSLRESTAATLAGVRELAEGERSGLKEILETEQRAVAETVKEQRDMVRQYVAALKETAGKLAEHRELFDRMAGERKAHQEAAAGMLARVKELLDSEQANMASIIETERRVVVEAVKEQRDMVRQYAGALQQTAAKLAEEHRQLFDRMALERAAHQEAVSEMVGRAKELLDSEQASLRDMLEAERRAIAEATARQQDLARQHVLALQQTAGKLGELINLQSRLEEGLLRASGSQGLAAVIGDVRNALSTLDPVLRRLVEKPLDVKVSFFTGQGPSTET